MSTPFDFLRRRLERTPVSRRRSLHPRTIDGVHLVDADGRRLLNFGSNDYLGFVMHADGNSMTNPSGSTASALVSGWSSDHQQLADTIAAWEGTERAVVLPTGYAACCGTMATLPGPDDLILSDALNHASLIDGCRMSKATKRIYRHRDVDHVRALLENHSDEHDQSWIVTDSVFSMDGDIAPLVELCDIADEFHAHLVVDEAHASGVFGAAGGGMCEELGVKDRVAIRIGTLSKAIGSQGGFVAGPEEVIETMINHCRMLIYSTALSMGAVHLAQRNLQVIQESDRHRVAVRRHAERVRESLGKSIDDKLANQVPIVPIVVGEDTSTTQTSRRLRDAGYFVPAIRPPTVPEGTARLRVSLSAAHCVQQINDLADHLKDLSLASA